MIFTQIFSIKMLYCERKKVKVGSKYPEKNAEKTKAILQENQRTFYERTEGTKRNSKNGAYKNIAYRKNKPWHNSGHFFSNFRVTSYTTPLIFFMSFVSWCESSRKWKCQSNDRLYKRIGKSERERVLEEKQRNPSKVCTSNEKAKAIWSI